MRPVPEPRATFARGLRARLGRTPAGHSLPELLLVLAVVGTVAAWGGVQEYQHERTALHHTVAAASLDVAMGADAALARTRVYPSDAGTFAPAQTALSAVHLAPGLEYRILNVDPDGLGAYAQTRRAAEPGYVCTVRLGRYAGGAAPAPVCASVAAASAVNIPAPTDSMWMPRGDGTAF